MKNSAHAHSSLYRATCANDCTRHCAHSRLAAFGTKALAATRLERRSSNGGASGPLDLPSSTLAARGCDSELRTAPRALPPVTRRREARADLALVQTLHGELQRRHGTNATLRAVIIQMRAQRRI